MSHNFNVQTDAFRHETLSENEGDDFSDGIRIEDKYETFRNQNICSCRRCTITGFTTLPDGRNINYYNSMHIQPSCKFTDFYYNTYTSATQFKSKTITPAPTAKELFKNDVNIKNENDENKTDIHSDSHLKQAVKNYKTSQLRLKLQTQDSSQLQPKESEPGTALIEKLDKLLGFSINNVETALDQLQSKESESGPELIQKLDKRVSFAISNEKANADQLQPNESEHGTALIEKLDKLLGFAINNEKADSDQLQPKQFEHGTALIEKLDKRVGFAINNEKADSDQLQSKESEHGTALIEKLDKLLGFAINNEKTDLDQLQPKEPEPDTALIEKLYKRVNFAINNEKTDLDQLQPKEPESGTALIEKLYKRVNFAINNEKTDLDQLQPKEPEPGTALIEKLYKRVNFAINNEKIEGEFKSKITLCQETKNDDTEIYKKALSNTSVEIPPEQNNNKPIPYRIVLGTAAALKSNCDSSKESVVKSYTATPKLNFKNEKKILKVPILNINARTYELEKFSKNAMIIFNHEHFYSDDPRLGTALDEAALRKTFKQFRFEVTTHHDLQKEPLFAELRKFAKQNFDDCGCICVAILTHGSDHGFLKAADMRYSEREVFACFDTLINPSLVAKPIIFLIQACRGLKLAKSVPLPFVSQGECTVQRIQLDSEVKRESRYFLPTEADLIIFHSCFYGRASGRVVDEGSWFIQTLCEQVNLYASKEHLEDIFRRVRKIIALEKGFEHAKQMPVLSSTLLRKLYLVRNGNLGSLNAKPTAIETESKVNTYLHSRRKDYTM